ncbi:hypothetical protein CK203_046126 [Vitis vinifera]|uniref:Uncharacterized protein n=1 Tax=Vitis vinifera TaxID=29760 RepID=A0A438HP40_VITVI|nr:hypothetical protein CK203_046126 [Vitis vinifera]
MMALKDMEKTSFITEWGTYCYRAMPFGLNYAGATYQRTTITLFHDMMHQDVKFRLRLNPKKYTFGVTFGKLLGYMVSERGIEEDPDKIRVILDMSAPRTEREIRGFLGRLQYISRFIKSIRGSIVVNHLAALPVSDGRAIDDDFSDEDIVVVTSLSDLFVWHSSIGHPTTNNIVKYEACILGLEIALELEIRQMEVFGDSNLSRSVPAYCCLIDEVELDDDCASADQVMKEAHAGVYEPHMGGHMLAYVIGKISPKSSSGHEFILVAIDYFTKWVEAASYARLTSSRVASFIRSHIIYRYKVPHELISDRGVHFRADVDTLLQRYGATPYSLVYGMDAVLPVEIEMGSLRVALEQQISEADWAQTRLDQLNLLDERRLRATYHVIRGLIRDPRGKLRPNWSEPYFRQRSDEFIFSFISRRQGKIAEIIDRPLQRGDSVLRVIRGLIRDPRGKFKPNWREPYFIRELTPEGVA